MHFKIRLLVLFIIQSHTSDAARILAIFGFSGRIQYAFVKPLLQELAQRGHNITAITNFPQPEPMENFREIVVEDNKNLFDDFRNYTMKNIGSNHYDIVHGFYNKAFQMCGNILNNQHVVQLRQNESFDLIILDVFLSESLFGFAEYFKAPLVGVACLGTMLSIDDLVGNTTPLSYIPDFIISRPYSSNMNFWLRCLNVVISTLEWIHYYYIYMPVQKKIYEHHFPNASMTFGEAQRNVSLVLLNDHYTISTPRPYVPNMIEVAGLHIPAESDPISGHFNRILQEAEKGVVYVDMDSVTPMYLMEMFLEEFRKIPQTVLWHIDVTPARSFDMPDNVHFSSNLTRYSVLPYPNIQLFICHSSYQDLIESIHYGVPILGIPNTHGYNEDYVDFIKKIVNGLSLSVKQLNAKSISKALNDLLATDHYRQNALLLSQRFRDQQNTPLEKATYWIEYVLRHNGATHMRNLGQNLNMWQYYNLDVIGCLILVILCFISLAYIVLKVVLKVIRIHPIKSIKRD